MSHSRCPRLPSWKWLFDWLSTQTRFGIHSVLVVVVAHVREYGRHPALDLQSLPMRSIEPALRGNHTLRSNAPTLEARTGLHVGEQFSDRTATREIVSVTLRPRRQESGDGGRMGLL